MVHRTRDEAAGEQAVDTESKLRRRQGADAAITVIKKQMLRCNKAGEQGRFKRGYLTSGGDQGGAAIFYLACLVVLGVEVA